MSDTRVLLTRIADFRKRLEAMPRLVPVSQGDAPAEPSVPTIADPAPTRTQAILQKSLRRLSDTPDAPPEMSPRLKRLLADAHGLVSRLRAVADDPLLAGPVSADADPLAVHYRETAALTEAAVRYAAGFPADADEQSRLCEGLAGMIDAAGRRFDLLAGVLEARHGQERRVEQLAGFLVAMVQGREPMDAAPLWALADEILAESPGRPIRWCRAMPLDRQACLGGREFPTPARYVAAHSLNVAAVLARVGGRDRDLVAAALLHDVGMLTVDPALLAIENDWDDEQRSAAAGHARIGSDIVFDRLPTLGRLAEVVAAHHERSDGSGYPAGLNGDQVSANARLVAVADVYAALCCPRPHRPAMDPRSAMTDVTQMAERGELDRSAANKLLGLGLYPTGSVVELADGSTGVVVGEGAERMPIALLTDAAGKALASPRFLEAAGRNNGVVRTLDVADRRARLGRSYPEWV